jgi:sulfate/thiosulfate transport system substrate-binding protein
MTIKFKKILLAAVTGSVLLGANAHAAVESILNVSYDVSRELYKDVNKAFEAQQKEKGQAKFEVRQSHGGSSKQALAVAAGLEADVVTMNQSPDIDLLVEKGLVDANWRKAFPNEATPYTTTTVFLVRKGNPKNIKDWSDLTRPELDVIVPNPKTSGNGRYTYLAAWGYSLDKTKSEAQAKQFVTDLFKNVPVLDGGGRGATTTFTQRGVGDVLVTFENEAILIGEEVGADKFDVVYPSISIDASAPVAIVKSVAIKRGSAAVAKQYLNFLYSPKGQEIIAKHHFRPRNVAVLAKYKNEFPPIKTFTVEEKLGGWAKVRNEHFSDGGIFDQIFKK